MKTHQHQRGHALHYSCSPLMYFGKEYVCVFALKVSQASRGMWSFLGIMEESVRGPAGTKASATADRQLVGAGGTRG